MKPSLQDLKRAAIANSLRSCQLFSGLSPADLDQLIPITSLRLIKKGEYVFREGDPSRGFFLVQQWAISVHRVNAAGKEQVIHVFRAGESFAEATLAHDSGYPASARALESSQVLFIQKAGFLSVFRKHPELALRMLAAMSLHLRTLVSQLQDLALRDVETRLANWLLKRCPPPHTEKPAIIQLALTKRVLAAEIGTVSETLSRTLAKFRQQNLVGVKGRTLTVQRPDLLARLLHRNLGETPDSP